MKDDEITSPVASELARFCELDLGPNLSSVPGEQEGHGSFTELSIQIWAPTKSLVGLNFSFTWRTTAAFINLKSWDDLRRRSHMRTLTKVLWRFLIPGEWRWLTWEALMEVGRKHNGQCLTVPRSCLVLVLCLKGTNCPDPRFTDTYILIEYGAAASLK